MTLTHMLSYVKLSHLKCIAATFQFDEHGRCVVDASLASMIVGFRFILWVIVIVIFKSIIVIELSFKCISGDLTDDEITLV